MIPIQVGRGWTLAVNGHYDTVKPGENSRGISRGFYGVAFRRDGKFVRQQEAVATQFRYRKLLVSRHRRRQRLHWADRVQQILESRPLAGCWLSCRPATRSVRDTVPAVETLCFATMPELRFARYRPTFLLPTKINRLLGPPALDFQIFFQQLLTLPNPVAAAGLDSIPASITTVLT